MNTTADSPAASRLRAALNKLAKWRLVIAGHQLGTRPMSDPEAEAVRDFAEARLLLRAEVTCLTRLLMENGLVTMERYQYTLAEEAAALDTAMERAYPGFKTTPHGIDMDVKVAAETTKGWRP